jgi:hypothetical protein
MALGRQLMYLMMIRRVFWFSVVEIVRVIWVDCAYLVSLLWFLFS